MAISVGSELPEATLFHIGEDGPSPLSIRDFAAGRKVVLFAVPGAFNTDLPYEPFTGLCGTRSGNQIQGC